SAWGYSPETTRRTGCGPPAPGWGWPPTTAPRGWRRPGRSRCARWLLLGHVDQEVGRPHEVVPQPGVLLRRKVEGVHGPPHLGQPRVPLDRPDPERRVPHPQPRVASALRVRVGSTPVLH